MASILYYDDPRAAIAWLTRAFGFEVRIIVDGPGNSVVHAELTFDDALIMVGATGKSDAEKAAWQRHQRSPQQLGGANTQTLCVHVDDVDAHAARARAAGAAIYREPATDDYGDDHWADRTYGARDPEGHMWWFMQRVRNPRSRGEH
jgi:uncharacterized glyoxalase superfamily protein PhnB